jgi:hypothetical protein
MRKLTLIKYAAIVVLGAIGIITAVQFAPERDDGSPTAKFGGSFVQAAAKPPAPAVEELAAGLVELTAEIDLANMRAEVVEQVARDYAVNPARHGLYNSAQGYLQEAKNMEDDADGSFVLVIRNLRDGKSNSVAMAEVADSLDRAATNLRKFENTSSEFLRQTLPRNVVAAVVAAKKIEAMEAILRAEEQIEGHRLDWLPLVSREKAAILLTLSRAEYSSAGGFVELEMATVAARMSVGEIEKHKIRGILFTVGITIGTVLVFFGLFRRDLVITTVHWFREKLNDSPMR